MKLATRKECSIILFVFFVTSVFGLTPEFYLNRAQRELAAHDDNHAISDCNRALESELSVSAYEIRARAYIGLGQVTEAENDVRTALLLNPKEPRVYFARALIKKYGGDFKGAIADLDQAIDLHGIDSGSYAERCVIKRCLGDFDAAILDGDKAVQLSAQWTRGYSVRGWAEKSAGKVDAARRDFNKAIAMNDKSAYYARGLLSYDLGKWEEARTDFERGCELQPQADYGQIRYWLVQVILNEKAKADKHLLQFLNDRKADSDHPWHERLNGFYWAKSAKQI